MNIQPRHCQVLLRMDIESDMSSGGIAMARSEADRTSQTRGTVVAVGPEVNVVNLEAPRTNPENTADARFEVKIEEKNHLELGSRVIVNGIGHSADLFKMNGSPHVLVDEKEILAVVTNENW